MANKSTKHHTAIGAKFYIQDDTMRKELLNVEKVSPSFTDVEWTTAEVYDVETGLTSDLKTSRNKKEYTFEFGKSHLDENEGLAMALAYAEEHGNKEEVYVVAVLNDGSELAVKGCIKTYTNGAYDKEAIKPTFVLSGNPCEAPANV